MMPATAVRQAVSLTDFSDERQCLTILSGLPLTDPARAQERLAALIAGMAQNPPPPDSYLRILETARSALDFVQTEQAARYALRPVAPRSEGEGVFHRVVALWQAICRAYADVASMGAGMPEVQAYIPLVCQRCIHYSGLVIIEYFRARREIQPGIWSEFHGYYATAEELGIAAVNVAGDSAGKPRYESCVDAYCAVLLADLANPYSRSPRELAWAWRWSRRFARLVVVQPAADGRQALHGVDFSLDSGPVPLKQLSDGWSLRQLVTDRLKDAIQAVLERLQQGADPAALGLGKDCVEPGTSRLMNLLFRTWCIVPRNRRFPRHSASGEAEITMGFESIHHQVAGKPFLQPGYRRTYSREEADHLVTLGESAEIPISKPTDTWGFAPGGHIWQLLDESVSGYRMKRENPGPPASHGDLMGLRPPGSTATLLARVSWVMYGGDGSMMVGVFLLPGSPRPLAVRPSTPPGSPEEAWMPGFLLPGMEALKEPPSLILPRSLYKPDKVLDVHALRPFRVRLAKVVNSGNDFARVSFIQG